MNEARGSDEIDIAPLIDQGSWSGYQKLLVALVALTVVFDGVDLQIVGVAVPPIMDEWGVTRGVFAPILAAGMVGMMFGASIAGVVGDRIGRRRALLGSIGVYSLATIGMGLATTPLALGVLRFIVGVGVGGAVPNASALAAEYVPARHRAMAVTLTIVCVPLGGALAGLLAVWILPHWSWRVLFFVGGVIPLAATAVLALVLVESPRYLARTPARWEELRRFLARLGHDTPVTATFCDGAEPAAPRPSTSALLTPTFRTDTLSLWAAFSACLLAVYLGFNWIPSMLTGAGLSPTVGSTGITMFNVGGVGGAILGAIAFARYGSRATMVTMALGAAIGAAALGFVPLGPDMSIAVLVILLTITGGLINAVQTTLYALAAQAYPSAIRSTGVGTASAVGRIGAILSTYVGAWTIEGGGSRFFFGAITGAMFLTAAALALIKRHIQARRR